MSLKQLIELIPPPANPIYGGTYDDWNDLEYEGIPKLPQGLFEIASHYGSGRFFQGSLKVFNPFAPDYYSTVKQMLDDHKQSREEFPEYEPYNAYPVEGGLFPFAFDDNGNMFYWQTIGKSDSWPVVCGNPRGSHWEKPLKHELSEFLVLLVTNNLKIRYESFWGNLYSEEDYNFRPQIIKSPRKKKKS